MVRVGDGWRLADTRTTYADLAVVDVTEIAWPHEPGDHRLAAAYLAGEESAVDPSTALAERLGFPVELVTDEAGMAELGAATAGCRSGRGGA